MDILTENYKLYHGDCLENVKLLDNKSIDLVIIFSNKFIFSPPLFYYKQSHSIFHLSLFQ